jgi:hypothetical protein
MNQEVRNTEARWSAIMWIGLAFAFAAAIAAVFYFGGINATRAHEEGTKRIEACVLGGGSWVDTYDLCINGSSS